MKKLLNTAILSAIEAGKAILKIYQSNEIDIKIKQDASPLTMADILSHKIINNYLSKTNIPILSEEGRNISYDERKSWDQIWIVDPLDGTKEFIKRNGEFTVNIALIENNKPIMGVVFAPTSGELYFSSKHIGAYKADIDFQDFDIEKLFVKAVKLPIKREDDNFTIVVSRSHMSTETEAFIQDKREVYGNVNLISKGSSLKLCMVAEGKADCYPRFAPTMEWDTAAGHAICINAGFKVIDWCSKEELLYNKNKLLNNWFLVTS